MILQTHSGLACTVDGWLGQLFREAVLLLSGWDVARRSPDYAPAWHLRVRDFEPGVHAWACGVEVFYIFLLVTGSGPPATRQGVQ